MKISWSSEQYVYGSVDRYRYAAVYDKEVIAYITHRVQGDYHLRTIASTPTLVSDCFASLEQAKQAFMAWWNLTSTNQWRMRRASRVRHLATHPRRPTYSVLINDCWTGTHDRKRATKFSAPVGERE